VRQSCCPKVPDHMKANVKQVIEGKAAPKVLKTQSDAVVTMGTKAKMAMYQGSLIQGFRSGQTNEISLTIASFFHSCNIPAHNANAPVFREMVQAIKMAPASYPPPPSPNNAASDDELLERLYDVAKTGVQYRVQDVAQFGWSLCSDGMTWLRRGLVNFVFQSATSGPIFLKCVDASGHMADGGTKDADFIAEQTLEVLKDSELLGRRLSSYKVAHCYAQTPWILRWVSLSSVLSHTPLSTLVHSLSIVRSTV
jgi:hypothetical protein